MFAILTSAYNATWSSPKSIPNLVIFAVTSRPSDCVTSSGKMSGWQLVNRIRVARRNRFKLWLLEGLYLVNTNGCIGSQAALRTNTSSMSSFGRIADVQSIRISPIPPTQAPFIGAKLSLHWAAYAKIRPHRRQLGRLKTMGD